MTPAITSEVADAAKFLQALGFQVSLKHVVVRLVGIKDDRATISIDGVEKTYRLKVGDRITVSNNATIVFEDEPAA